MKSNQEIQKKVHHALQIDPVLEQTSIEVHVQNQIATLSGLVDTYLQKQKAENIAQNIKGVRAVVTHIENRQSPHSRSDQQIAEAVLEILRWQISVPEEQIKIAVSQGWVFLQGEVEWNYQKSSAQKAIELIPDIKGVVNAIQIQSLGVDKIEKQAIETALKKSASLENNNIRVYIANNVVTLVGVVHADEQKEEAERIVWNAPNIWVVHNLISIKEHMAQSVA